MSLTFYLQVIVKKCLTLVLKKCPIQYRTTILCTSVYLDQKNNLN